MNAQASETETRETVRLINQFAAAAHKVVDHLENSAVSLDLVLEKRSEEATEGIKAGISKEAGNLQKYVEKNPGMAAMVAFAFGVAATRFFKSPSAGEAAPEEKATKAA